MYNIELQLILYNSLQGDRKKKLEENVKALEAMNKVTQDIRKLLNEINKEDIPAEEKEKKKTEAEDLLKEALNMEKQLVAEKLIKRKNDLAKK